jgi:transcription initiation factor TFIID subunit 6
MDSGVKIVAQSLGIESLDDRIAAALAPDVEYRIRHLVQDGLKFAEHAQRDTLTVEDINAALRVRNVEGLYGFSGLDSMKFTKIGDQSEDLFMLKDKVESFATMLAEPVLKCPMAPSFTTHWLAVEGVQPTIPQNPTLKSKRGGKSS